MFLFRQVKFMISRTGINRAYLCECGSQIVKVRKILFCSGNNVAGQQYDIRFKLLYFGANLPFTALFVYIRYLYDFQSFYIGSDFIAFDNKQFVFSIDIYCK